MEYFAESTLANFVGCTPIVGSFCKLLEAVSLNFVWNLPRPICHLSDKSVMKNRRSALCSHYSVSKLTIEFFPLKRIFQVDRLVPPESEDYQKNCNSAQCSSHNSSNWKDFLSPVKVITWLRTEAQVSVKPRLRSALLFNQFLVNVCIWEPPKHCTSD
jgi:hypothetical protein